MPLRPRYTAQLVLQAEPEMRAELEDIHEHDPAAPSLAAAGRLLLRLGLIEYRKTKPRE